MSRSSTNSICSQNHGSNWKATWSISAAVHGAGESHRKEATGAQQSRMSGPMCTTLTQHQGYYMDVSINKCQTETPDWGQRLLQHNRPWLRLFKRNAPLTAVYRPGIRTHGVCTSQIQESRGSTRSRCGRGEM